MKQKITFLVLSILLIGLFIFKYDKVIEEQKEDEIETILSLTIDGEKAENFPSKESGKTIERIECEEGYLASTTGEMGPFSSVTYGTQQDRLVHGITMILGLFGMLLLGFIVVVILVMVLLRECFRRFLEMVIYVHGLVIESF